MPCARSYNRIESGVVPGPYSFRTRERGVALVWNICRNDLRRCQVGKPVRQLAAGSLSAIAHADANPATADEPAGGSRGQTTCRRPWLRHLPGCTTGSDPGFFNTHARRPQSAPADVTAVWAVARPAPTRSTYRQVGLQGTQQPGGIRPGNRGFTPPAPPCARLYNRAGSGVIQ